MENKILRRSITFDKPKIDVEKRTVTLPVSSETPVSRWFGREILSHADGSVDLSRMNAAAPILSGHDWDIQTGVVERAWLEGGRMWMELRFGRSPAADIEFNDVIDGIRRNVSIGYMVEEPEQPVRAMRDGEDFIATRWVPYEVSFVSVPADITVGVGRSLREGDDGQGSEPEGTTRENPKNKTSQIEGTKMTEQEMKDAIENAKREAIREFETKQAADKARISEIRAMAERFCLTEEGRKAEADGMTVDAFRALVLERQAAKATAAPMPSAKIGMSEKDVRKFSFCRAIMSQIPGVQIDAGFERECSAAVAKMLGRDPKGIFVPYDVIAASERTFNLTTGGGSNMVATNLYPDMFIEMLRNSMVLSEAGAFFMPGLVGNVAIPRQTGVMTGYWFNSETHGITAASNPTVDQVTMSPNTVGAYGDISRSLLKQGTPSAEQLVRQDIAAVLGLLIDLAGLKGTGGTQPTGITQTSGINSGNWASANTPTWAELVAMETAVDVANALRGSFRYVMGANLVGKCKTTLKDSGVSGYLMESDKTINGYPVANSNQMAAGECLFGRFDDLIIGMWGSLDLQVNPYIEALEKAGAIRVTALQDVDCAVRKPKSFTFYSNSPST